LNTTNFNSSLNGGMEEREDLHKINSSMESLDLESGTTDFDEYFTESVTTDFDPKRFERRSDIGDEYLHLKKSLVFIKLMYK
jgi:hypothetical protein